MIKRQSVSLAVLFVLIMILRCFKVCLCGKQKIDSEKCVNLEWGLRKFHGKSPVFKGKIFFVIKELMMFTLIKNSFKWAFLIM